MSACVRKANLATIDLSSARLRDPKGRKTEIDNLIEAFSTYGVCYITGIEGYNTQELLKWTKWFFYEIPKMEKIEQLATR